MKILQINSVYGFGSTGKIVENIHNKLVESNIESFVIYSRNNDYEDDRVFKYYSQFGFLNHVIQGVIFDKHGLLSKKNTNNIINKIEEIKPDIIHIHNIHGFFCNYPMLFKYMKDNNIPIVWTLHDCWSYTGYCAYYDYNKCDEWKKGCKNCKYRNTYPYRILSNSINNYKLKKNLYSGLNVTLVTPSKWLSNEVSESLLCEKKCMVINNSVNLTDFHKTNNETLKKVKCIENKQIYLAVANYWTNQKGFNEYLKLSKLLNDEEVLVMIGLNSKQIKKLPKNIIGVERVSKEELCDWYSISNAFINLTLEDNYPTVNLEARSCKLPVFTYRTGGSTELVENENYICEKYDLDHMITIVRKYKDNTISDIRSTYSMEKKYIELYNTILSG